MAILEKKKPEIVQQPSWDSLKINSYEPSMIPPPQQYKVTEHWNSVRRLLFKFWRHCLLTVNLFKVLRILRDYLLRKISVLCDSCELLWRWNQLYMCISYLYKRILQTVASHSNVSGDCGCIRWWVIWEQRKWRVQLPRADN